MSLTGYFFDTPHSLYGVDWSLRVEVCFYTFFCGILLLSGAFKRAPLVLLYATPFLLLFVGDIPNNSRFDHGYLTAYFIFLLIGISFALRDLNRISSIDLWTYFIFGLCAFLIMHDTVTLAGHPQAFAVYAGVTFAIAWYCKDYFTTNRLVIQISKLTYAYYLFHYWLYPMVLNFILDQAIFPIIISHTLAIAIFTVMMFAAFYIVEDPMYRLGKTIIKKLPQRKAHSEPQST